MSQATNLVALGSTSGDSNRTCDALYQDAIEPFLAAEAVVNLVNGLDLGREGIGEIYPAIRQLLELANAQLGEVEKAVMRAGTPEDHTKFHECMGAFLSVLDLAVAAEALTFEADDCDSARLIPGVWYLFRVAHEELHEIQKLTMRLDRTAKGAQ